MQAKLNPQYVSGTAQGKLNFPGFQEILNFTSVGSESSISVTVDGDVDKEYKVIVRNLITDQHIYMRMNADAGATSYGYQRIYNDGGNISAARGTLSGFYVNPIKGLNEYSIFTPTGFLKTGFMTAARYDSGTALNVSYIAGSVYNSTSNITSLGFYPASGNFVTGTSIIVYARRSNL